VSLSRKPHTVIAYQRNGVTETLGRPGHLTMPEAAALMAKLGVSGEIVVRHHAPAMFGKGGRTVKVDKGRVG
jgi:hypothetical protein